MIHTDRQLNITREELEKLRAALVGHEAAGHAGEAEWLRQTHIDALRSQISEFETDIAEYELLRSGKIRVSEMASLQELPRALIRARIASGMSQSDLAERLNMKPQQIQRYESSNYMSASLARLIEVAGALGIRLTNSFGRQDAASALVSWNGLDDVAWHLLPAKEMARRRWFDVPKGQSITDAARHYVVANAGSHLVSAFHRKKVRSGTSPDVYALLAWQARVFSVSSSMLEGGNFPEFKLNMTWLSEIVHFSCLDDGPARAKHALAERGIILVIEGHFENTYLDGAAMLGKDDVPIVALTLRHDRLDNFWFTLFHEIGHIFRHLAVGLRFDFFDEGDAALTDELEKEADEFALEILIPSSEWDQCLSRFVLTEEAVRIDASRLGVGPSIVAGRIRKERNDYTILTSLVGQGALRTQFVEFQK